MRLEGTVEVAAVDPERVRDALESLIVQVRALDVVDTIVEHPVTGRALPWLRVVSGSHPRPGTKYDATEYRLGGAADNESPLRVGDRSIAAGDPTAAKFRDGALSGLRESTSQIELVADDRRRVELAVTPEGGGRSVLTIADPARPTELTFTFSVPGGTSWWTKGDMSTECQVDLTELSASGGSSRRPITVRSRHRRFAAKGGVDVETSSSGWLMHVDVVARGRGMARPLAAAFGVLFGWLIRRSFNEMLAEWEADGAPLIAKINHPGDPQQVASAWLVDLLASHVDESPPST